MNITSSSSELIIDCDAEYSCYQAVIYFTYEFMGFSRIDCDAYQYSCNSMAIYIDEYQQEMPLLTRAVILTELDLQLSCMDGATGTACDKLTFYCQDNQTSNSLRFDQHDKQYLCEQENDCCYYTEYEESHVTIQKLSTAFTTTTTTRNDVKYNTDLYVTLDEYSFNTTSVLETSESGDNVETKNIQNVNDINEGIYDNQRQDIWIFVLIGVIVFVINLGIIAIYCCRKRRKNTANGQQHKKTTSEMDTEGDETETNDLLIEEEYTNKLKDLADFISMHPHIISKNQKQILEMTETDTSKMSTNTTTEKCSSTKFSHLDTDEQLVEMTCDYK